MYQNDPKRVLTPECRLSYCNLVTARAPQNGVGDPKFSVTLLIPKSNPTIKQELDAAMNAAAEVGVNAKWNGVRPARIESVVHDGDGVRPSGEPFGEECRGCWVVTASSKNKPYVCGADNVNCELAPTDIYSGMYARVSINFYAYNSAGKRGVGCGLRAVMKTRDGEPLSRCRRRSAAGPRAGLRYRPVWRGHARNACPRLRRLSRWRRSAAGRLHSRPDQPHHRSAHVNHSAGQAATQ